MNPMAGVLTLNLVYQKAKCDEVDRIRKLNVCSSSLQDIGVLRHLKNLELLSLSVNDIDEIGALSGCSSLTELYLRRNKVQDINQVLHLSRLPHLQVLNLSDNPICRDSNYRSFVVAAIPSLRVLDDVRVTPEERQNATQIFPQLAFFAPPSSAYAMPRGGAAPAATPPKPSSSCCHASRPASSHQDPHAFSPPASSAYTVRSGTAASTASAGPREAGVVQAIKVLCAELSPSGLREIHRFLDSMSY